MKNNYICIHTIPLSPVWRYGPVWTGPYWFADDLRPCRHKLEYRDGPKQTGPVMSSVHPALRLSTGSPADRPS